MKKPKDKINVLIIGNGHYATGSTVLEGEKETDKDWGVVLPSMLELRRQGLVNKIYLAGRNGSKFSELRKKLELMRKKFGWDADIILFPQDNEVKDTAYIDAFRSLPKPAGVVIATPDHLHKEMMLESIRLKNHFMVVKPAVTKLADLEEVIKQQEKAGVLGLVDYHKVYDEANLILKENYEQGKYGDIQHIFTKMTQRRDMLKIFQGWIGEENNVNHYLNSHYIHLVGFITKAIPLNVRATCQFGIAQREHNINTPDLIETQIVWRAKNGTKFTSYHVAGWADPSETAAMTYQEIHIIGTKGHVESDQRHRGLETTLFQDGQGIINPYFFHLNKGIDGGPDLEGKYGFKSMKVFIKSALAIENGTGVNCFEGFLPTIKESRAVTAILEAADRSLQNNSSIVQING